MLSLDSRGNDLFYWIRKLCLQKRLDLLQTILGFREQMTIIISNAD